MKTYEFKLVDEPRKSAQYFSQYEDEYYLGNDDQLHLKPQQRDCQARIDSYRSTLMDMILDRYLDYDYGTVNTPQDVYIDERVNALTKLDDLMAADAVIAAAREEYKLPANTSRAKVIAIIKDKASQSFDDWIKAVDIANAGKEDQKNEKNAPEEAQKQSE